MNMLCRVVLPSGGFTSITRMLLVSKLLWCVSAQAKQAERGILVGQKHAITVVHKITGVGCVLFSSSDLMFGIADVDSTSRTARSAS